jgi:hypothetical protein
MHPSLRIALSATVLVSLVACGGGGGGSSPAAVSGAALSGKVIDGPISGATVCLDVNSNNTCDTGEPTATTDATGNYTLPEYAGSLDGLHILAVVPAGAIDLDTNTAVTDAYIMLAPAKNPSFVTPLTTLVSAQMLANPSLTVTAAEQATIVTNRLSAQTSNVLDIDVTQNSALHKIAQATAIAMGKVQSTLSANTSFTTAATASNNGTTASQAATQAVRLTQAGLLQSMQKSDGSIHGSFVNNGSVNANAVNTLVSNTVNNSIDGVVAATLVGKASNMDMATELTAGMKGFKISNGGFYIDGSNRITTAPSRHYKAEVWSTSGHDGSYRDINGTWFPNSETFFDLVSNAWVAEAKNGAANSANALPVVKGNCFTATQTTNAINLTACGTAVTLSGKKLSDFGFDCIDPSGSPISGCNVNAVFPANSTGYNIQVSYDNDQYQIRVPTDGSSNFTAANMTSFIGTFQGTNYISLTGNCTIVITVESYNPTTKQGVINWYNNTSNSCTNLSNTIGAMTVAETTPFKVETHGNIDVLLVNYANAYYQATGNNDETLLFGYVPANVSGNNTAGIYMGNFYSSKRTVSMYFGMSDPNMMNTTAYNFLAGQYQLPNLP